MKLANLVRQIVGFDSLEPREKIKLFCWYLHAHGDAEVITNAQVRNCFRELNYRPPDVSVYLPRMVGKELIEVRGGYKLEGTYRRALDEKYGDVTVVVTSRLLSELPAKVPDISEQAFLDETLRCYRAGAFRATIVMVWNLAFDHLVAWILREQTRLDAFNAAIPVRYPKRSGLKLGKREDFDELKEFEIIEVAYTAGLVSKNRTEILRERLKRRNMAAHPSQVTIEQPQADDMISDLVNNLVLALI